MSDKVWWEYYCKLFPSTKTMDIDPHIRKCVCGHKWYFNRLQLIWMFIRGRYVYTCPQCQRKSQWKFIGHVVKDMDTDKIKENNRWLD